MAGPTCPDLDASSPQGGAPLPWPWRPCPSGTLTFLGSPFRALCSCLTRLASLFEGRV